MVLVVTLQCIALWETFSKVDWSDAFSTVEDTSATAHILHVHKREKWLNKHRK